MRLALGISVHTGWGACVCVAGSLRRPEILANGRVDMLGDAERFCFHMAAEMPEEERAAWIANARRKAVANAKRELAGFLRPEVCGCAIVARSGAAADLRTALQSHTRIHTAEGCFYRDVLREACPVACAFVAPDSLDVTSVPKLAKPPWGRDQKLAALAAWSLLARGPRA